MGETIQIGKSRKKQPLDEASKMRRKKNGDILFALIPVLLMAVYYFGVRSLFLAAYAIIFSVASDYLCLRLTGQKKWQRYDLSSLISPLILVLILPASIPYWIAIVGVLIANLVAKYPFGGYGKNIFNPAAVAFAILAIGWPDRVFAYPQPFDSLGISSTVQASLGQGIAYRLQLGGAPSISGMDRLLGHFAGPMGATCILVLIACGIYLLARRTISWQIVLGTLGSSALIAFLFPRILVGRLDSVSFEMIAGILLFGAVFMASDPVTSPKTGWGKALYGVLLGTLTMLFRYFGKMEITFAYALLLCNAVAPKCDEYMAVAVKGVKAGCRALLKKAGSETSPQEVQP